MTVVQKTAGAEKALVAHQLLYHLGHSGRVSVVDVVHGALVVHSTAGHEVTGRRKGHRHHPGRSQGDDLHLVGGPRVPDDQLAIQGSSDAVARVPGEVHGVHLVDVPLENLLRGEADLGHIAHVAAFVAQRAVRFGLLVLLENNVLYIGFLLTGNDNHVGLTLFWYY